MPGSGTRYARSGDVSIAYQIVGSGEVDLVFVPGSISNVEFGWEVPPLARFWERLGDFSRLITFDKRGTGVSDRVRHVATLETRMDDVRAVMDDAGSERAVVMGVSEGGPMSVLFAATYPERTQGLILFGSDVRGMWAPDFPWAPTEQEWRDAMERVETTWGTSEANERMIARFAPSLVGDEEFTRLWAMFRRLSASPGAVADLARMNALIDVSDVLPAIRVPTLVLHRVGDLVNPIEVGRYIAARVPGARLVELPGNDHFTFAGDVDSVIEEVRRFVSEVPVAPPEPKRLLATVLFTDLVGSTAKAVELGDSGWRQLLLQHHTAIRAQLAAYQGREIDTAGDGFFASGFDGPARAIRCAKGIVDAVKEIDLDVRVGLHTGECEVVDGKLAGIAVNIGARVAAQAAPGEVLVSSTVKDLVAGSGITFRDRGSAELKGIPGEWRLFAVESV